MLSILSSDVKNLITGKLNIPCLILLQNTSIELYDLLNHEINSNGFRTRKRPRPIPVYDRRIALGANMGITHMTKEHIALCLSFKIPFFVVFTKIDIAPESVYEETKKRLNGLLKSPGIRKMIINMKNNC